MCNLKVKAWIFTELLAFFSNRPVAAAGKKGRMRQGTLVLVFYVTNYM
jgi:hypothetical protein